VSSVDNRIVNMKFDNAAFEKGAATTMSTLDKLKQSLNFKDSAKGMQDVQSSVNKFNMGTMEAAVTGVSNKFIALTTIAVTALSTITSKAIESGTQIVKSLTIDPIAAGFREYEQKIGSIQTIMAGSGESLKTVNKYLKELNEYSDQTIYSFADMTSNIGKFTNAGVSLKDSVASIKGVANVAALSGANAEEASRAMYNFAQALSSGAVRLQDWKSIELANMGTKEFKQQLIDAAVAAGTLRKSAGGMYETITSKKRLALSATKGFNDSLTEEWLTTEVLNETLADYADASTDIGKRATAAASDIKTFSQMLDTLKESAGSGWAETWELVFGDFNEAKKLWTGLGNFFGGIIQRSSDARNAVLKTFIDVGGKKSLVAGLTNVFTALGNILTPIKEAFRDIFPPITGERLAELTKNFEEFTSKLKIGEAAMETIRRIASGVASVFSIVKQVVSGAISGIATAIGAIFKVGAGEGGAGFATIAANVGDFVTNIDEMLKRTGAIKSFFTGIGSAIGTAVGSVVAFVGSIGDMLTGKENAFLDNLSEKFSGLGPIIQDLRNTLEAFADTVKNFIGGLGLGELFNFGDDAEVASENIEVVTASLETSVSLFDRIKSAATAVVNAIRSVISWISEGFQSLAKNTSAEDLLAIVNTGFLIALWASIRGFTAKIGDLIGSFTNVMDSASGVLTQVTDNLKTMQTDVRAKIILRIAAAILLLAASIYILSKINPEDLGIALSAVVLLVAVMVKAVKALEVASRTSSITSSSKMLAISVSLIALAGAILILAIAAKILSKIDLGGLAKGVGAIAVISIIIVKMVEALEKSKAAGEMVKAAVALGILAAALLLFALALKVFDALDASALVDGLWKIVAVVAGVGLAMKAFPKNPEKGAAALLVTAIALEILADVLKRLGKMSGGDLAKALVTLAVSLVLIVAATRGMTGALPGAQAMILVAGALFVLALALKMIGSMPVASIVIALVTLVAVLTILGVAAYLLAPVVPIIDALAAAILLLGLAALAAGAGMFLFATGLTLLTVAGVAGISILTAAIIAIAELIPLIAHQIGLGIVAFADVIGDKAPEILKAFGKMLDALLEFILEYAPKIYDAGFDLISSFLDVLIDRVPELSEKGGDLVVALIEGIGKQQLKIIKAAGETLLAFLEGLTDWINDNKTRFNNVGRELGKAIIDGVIAGVTGFGGGVKDALLSMARNAWDAVKNFFKSDSPSKLAEELGKWIDVGLGIGVDKHADEVASSMEDMGVSAVSAFQKTMSRLVDAVDSDMEIRPVIAPVIDLTQVRAGADKINSILATRPLTTDVSFAQAASISAIRQPVDTTAETGESAQIVFEQNNYSPKALTPLEIYRNTRNQISLAKEALAG
jgi:tape measure domain-containing protein